ncbi:MAG: hypothetical protein WCF84_15735 [Anaerolineae bacterium]
MRGLFIGGTLFGLVIGLVVGLLISWVFWPVTYVDADPSDLRLDLKDDYQRMIAAAYSLDGDMARAWTRLGSLQLQQPAVSVADLAQRETKPMYQQALIHLALDLKQPAIAMARPTYTPRPSRTSEAPYKPPTVRPRATASRPPTPTAILETPTPEPTSLPPTSAPNPAAPRYELVSKTAQPCSQARGPAHIEVQVQDKNGNPAPGVGVEINWDAGDEIVYTGLKPEHGFGFANLTVRPGAYNVRLTDTAQSPVVEGLDIEADASGCAPESAIYGWQLVFRAISN